MTEIGQKVLLRDEVKSAILIRLGTFIGDENEQG
jgi:hypothetical protein